VSLIQLAKEYFVVFSGVSTMVVNVLSRKYSQTHCQESNSCIVFEVSDYGFVHVSGYSWVRNLLAVLCCVVRGVSYGC